MRQNQSIFIGSIGRTGAYFGAGAVSFVEDELIEDAEGVGAIVVAAVVAAPDCSPSLIAPLASIQLR